MVQRPFIYILCFTLFLFSFSVKGQNGLRGKVVGPDNELVIGAAITIEGIEGGTITTPNGDFELPGILYRKGLKLKVSHIEYEDLIYSIEKRDFNRPIVIKLVKDTKFLNQIEVVGFKENENKGKISTIEIDSESITDIPTAFGDISKILVTLPGVSTTNELSSSFAVRGGNFDENSIYINDIPVYRPFLIRAGRQEGLSTINADLVGNILFSAGGWESKYGDRLSSVLNITYKEPKDFEGKVSAGLLTSSIYLGGRSKSKKTSYLVGARRKSSTYLLNSLETDGQYLPSFFDVQGLLMTDISGKSNLKRKIQWFNSFARNRYEVIPETRTTDFGGLGNAQRLLVGFEGAESLDYDTYQSGFSLDYQVTDRLRTKLILSAVATQEIERVNVEGGYQLCDIDSNPNSNAFDQCVAIRAFGTFFNFGRNTLRANILSGEVRNELKISDNTMLEVGFGVNQQDLNDRLQEFSFIDSADFTTITDRRINDVDLVATNSFGYLQTRMFFNDSLQYMVIGVRANYRDINSQFLLGPRLLYSLKLNERSRSRFKLAAGLYHQPPFYRELRNREGVVNTAIEAQSSAHFILGFENEFSTWGRPFKFTAEAYYKNLSNVNAYDLDNVRIRYFGNNLATGYAAGVDFRLNGEFIKGAQSWFSLGLLKTEEDIAEDDRGLIRRPSDQLVNLGFFFQDHLQNNPTVRVNLSFLYTSNLPFGPPRRDDRRNSLEGDDYVRTDIGFAKIITFSEHTRRLDIEKISIGLDVLNLFGNENSISYLWIRDVQNIDRPIPNSLSARFFNARVSVNF